MSSTNTWDFWKDNIQKEKAAMMGCTHYGSFFVAVLQIEVSALFYCAEGQKNSPKKNRKRIQAGTGRAEENVVSSPSPAFDP